MGKKTFTTGIFLLSFITFLLSGCSNKPVNGWYFMDDSGEKIVGTPILTVQDFAELKLDSSSTEGITKYVILGSIKEDKITVFADATEKAIGKKLGFLFENEIITAPMVNQRIEGGRFSISSSEFDNNRARVMEIYNSLMRKE